MKKLSLLFFIVLATKLVVAQFQLNGVATNLGGGSYQLTPATNGQFGALWYKLQHNLNNSFNVQGTMNFGSDPGGADGIAFVMQNGCLAAGGAGGGLGFSGIPGQSIGVEFDTYQNILGTGAEDNNDPAYDHIAIETNGDVVHDGSANDLTLPIQMDASLTNVKNGTWYPFQINYNAITHVINVYFNGSLRTSATIDIKTTVFAGNPWVYWGFTSSTGGYNNIQQINIDAALSTHVLIDTTICSGSIPIDLKPLTSLRGTNVALNNPIYASSIPGTAIQANDGNMASRWESVWGVDPQWMYVDLQSPTDIDSVVLYWEGAYATSYEIQTSNDAVSWNTEFSTTTSDGGKDKIIFSASNVRYVRVYGTVRSLSAYGYSIWEFQVFGLPKYLWSPNDGTVSDIYGSSVTLTPLSTTTYSVLIPDACVGTTTYNMTVTVSCPAPVTLLDFTANAFQQHTQLHWSTSSEINSDYFEVMKSKDGIHFYSIGMVKAAGSSHQVTNYSFTDTNPGAGITYYKLVIVDKDLLQEESKSISVTNYAASISIANSAFEIETILSVSTEKEQQFDYVVYDMVGKLVYKSPLLPTNQSYSFGENLAMGNYVIQVKLNGIQQQYKITKLR